MLFGKVQDHVYNGSFQKVNAKNIWNFPYVGLTPTLTYGKSATFFLSLKWFLGNSKTFSFFPYFTVFWAKKLFSKIISYLNLFLLLQLTHSHWNFRNLWSLQGSEAKRRFCLHLGQASHQPTGWYNYLLLRQDLLEFKQSASPTYGKSHISFLDSFWKLPSPLHLFRNLNVQTWNVPSPMSNFFPSF